MTGWFRLSSCVYFRVRPEDPPVLVDTTSDEDEDEESKVSAWGRRLKHRRGRSLGLLERFPELPEPRSSPYGTLASLSAATSERRRYKGRGRMRYDRAAPGDDHDSESGQAAVMHDRTPTFDGHRRKGGQDR